MGQREGEGGDLQIRGQTKGDVSTRSDQTFFHM